MVDGGRLDGLLRDVLGELSAVEFDSPDSVDDAALIEMLRVGAAVERAAQRVGVQAVAALQRRGVFARLGQRAVTALADLLGVEHVEARRVVTAAEQVIPRVDLQGQVLPARLPATADAFAAGTASVRHVEVIARLMGGAAASRLSPETLESVEQQLAAQVGNYTPTVLRDWGATLLNLLDQDGSRPDDRDPRDGNELRLTRDPHGGGENAGGGAMGWLQVAPNATAPPDGSDVGEFIRWYRMREGLSQQAVADRLHTTQSKLEKGTQILRAPARHPARAAGRAARPLLRRHTASVVCQRPAGTRTGQPGGLVRGPWPAQHAPSRRDGDALAGRMAERAPTSHPGRSTQGRPRGPERVGPGAQVRRVALALRGRGPAPGTRQ
jgi:hypothetical protein